MDTQKLALLALAVVVVGIFALPSTLSLFAGQHVWYDIGDEGNQVPCKKCHADVYEEFLLSGVHKTLAEGSDANSSFLGTGYNVDTACGACHRVNLSEIGWTFGSGDTDGSTPGKEAHAAAVISCMVCHQLNNTGGYPGAGGFNVSSFDVTTPYMYDNNTNPGAEAAHNAFIAEAIKDDTLKDSNEACIACHTYIAVKINWTHAQSLEFDVGIPDDPDQMTTPTGVHNWTMTNWDVNGTASATVWGNTTGAGSTDYDSNWPGDVDGVYN